MTEKAKSIKIGFNIALCISLACMLVLTAIVWTIGIAWGVRRSLMEGPESDTILSSRQKAFLMAVAEFPVTARETIEYLIGKDPRLSLRAEHEQPGWIRRFPFATDSGYLLFSGLYRNESTASVKLIRIADGQVIATWAPNWRTILSKTTTKKFDFPGNLSNSIAVNPVLLDDGDIIFSTGSASVRLPACSSEPRWVLNETMHHSTDLDADGKSFWSPSVSLDGFPGNDVLRSVVRNDAIARVSLDGKLLERRSFSDISQENQLDFLLFNGNSWGDFNSDPIHMNEIRSARSDSKFWMKGDLLISLRNPNAVMLYRPSTRKVVWHQEGPWLHQHSVDFVNDHQISIFNNNVVLKSPDTAVFLTPQSYNEVMVFDFETGRTTQPFRELLQSARVKTFAQGRSRLLPDGGLFVEETENGRILRFSRDQLLWSFVNDHDDKYIGVLAWSSYLTAEEARKPIEALAARRCLSGSASEHAGRLPPLD